MEGRLPDLRALTLFGEDNDKPVLAISGKPNQKKNPPKEAMSASQIRLIKIKQDQLDQRWSSYLSDIRPPPFPGPTKDAILDLGIAAPSLLERGGVLKLFKSVKNDTRTFGTWKKAVSNATKEEYWRLIDYEEDDFEKGHTFSKHGKYLSCRYAVDVFITLLEKRFKGSTEYDIGNVYDFSPSGLPLDGLPQNEEILTNEKKEQMKMHLIWDNFENQNLPAHRRFGPDEGLSLDELKHEVEIIRNDYVPEVGAATDNDADYITRALLQFLDYEHLYCNWNILVNLINDVVTDIELQKTSKRGHESFDAVRNDPPSSKRFKIILEHVLHDGEQRKKYTIVVTTDVDEIGLTEIGETGADEKGLIVCTIGPIRPAQSYDDED